MREQSAWFLHEKKSIICVDGLELSDADRVLLAAQAVLPVLNLGFDAYDDWHEIIVYPGQFLSRDRYTDHYGLVHEYEQILAGQARSDGPVLLSWLDVSQSAWLDGWNVVIHEFAHKLDMRDGAPNGRPPLHAGMDAAQWKAAFSRAFSHLSRLAHTGEYSPIDLYAAENPAECFAVMSEYFFLKRRMLLRSNTPRFISNCASSISKTRSPVCRAFVIAPRLNHWTLDPSLLIR